MVEGPLIGDGYMWKQMEGWCNRSVVTRLINVVLFILLRSHRLDF
jgi:hypothetical protein